MNTDYLPRVVFVLWSVLMQLKRSRLYVFWFLSLSHRLSFLVGRRYRLHEYEIYKEAQGKKGLGVSWLSWLSLMLAFVVFELFVRKTVDHKKPTFFSFLFFPSSPFLGKTHRLFCSRRTRGSKKSFNGQLPSLIWRRIDRLSSGCSLIYSFLININKSLAMATPQPRDVTSALTTAH